MSQIDLSSLTDDQLGLTALWPALQNDDDQDSMPETRQGGLWGRFLFDGEGRPTALSKFVLLGADGKSRRLSRRLMLRKNGTVRAHLQDWYGQVQEARAVPDGAGPGYGRQIRTLHMVTTKHTEFLAQMMGAALAGGRFVISQSTEMPQTFDHDFYIVACPQMFDRLPPRWKRIVVQLEQSGVSQWFTPGYLKMLRNSVGVLDYSLENIDYLARNGVARRKLFYLPIQPIDRALPQGARDIDVLFYGALGKSRRLEILAELGKHHRVRIENGLFGSALDDLLHRAKVVVNIHYYGDALLETTRLAQALSCGAKVVSELAADQARHAFFDDKVRFVPVGDVAAMSSAIAQALAEPEGAVGAVALGLSDTKFMLHRALFGCGVMGFQDLWAGCGQMALPKGPVVLTEPERLAEHDLALRDPLRGSVAYPGLRLGEAWMGEALSYKFLAMLAVQQGRRALTVQAGAAAIVPAARLAAVAEVMAGEAAVCDVVLVGKGDEVSDVMEIAGERCVRLERLGSLGVSIWGSAGLTALAGFRFEGTEADQAGLTAYLNAAGLRACALTQSLSA